MKKSKLKIWTDAITTIKEGNQKSSCPICGSPSLQYKETVLDVKSGQGYADIWCEECKNAFHVSRGIFDVSVVTADAVPEDLSY